MLACLLSFGEFGIQEPKKGVYLILKQIMVYCMSPASLVFNTIESVRLLFIQNLFCQVLLCVTTYHAHLLLLRLDLLHVTSFI